jgi:hypothetical protein
MHIYRLAIELGLIEAKYLDRRARQALVPTLSREETQRLQRVAADPNQWGCWVSEIHASGTQLNRQYRAYSIYYDERGSVSKTADGWLIQGYSVTLGDCACMDFSDRNLPCKHIYAAALDSEISLSLKYADYDAARNKRWRLYLNSVPAPKRLHRYRESKRIATSPRTTICPKGPIPVDSA